MAWSLAGSPEAWRALKPPGFHLRLLGRTLAYNLGVAAMATLLAIPVALVLGRGRGWLAGALALAVPIALLLPSIVYAYGWMRALWIAHFWVRDQRWLAAIGIHGVYPEFAGAGDVLRCMWTLATWLWPVPAGIMGLSLRRMDADLQQQALLDGAYWRMTIRRLAGPALAGVAIVAILAMQEFAIYESTGISVVATEVKTVFQTGQVGLLSGAVPGSSAEIPTSDQRRSATAAVVTAAPLLLVVGLFALVAWSLSESHPEQGVEGSRWPRILDATWRSKALAIAVVLIAIVLPLAAMLASLRRWPDPVRIWNAFSKPVLGSLLVGALAAGVAITAGLCGLVRRINWPILIGLICFLVGGQILAIALIRLYNHPAAPWNWIYNGPAILIMAYLARFGWLAMWAARSTWRGGWAELRDMAALDGATPLRAARSVVLPLAWPMLLAAGLLVLLLSMTEVPSTALLPMTRVPVFIPMLLNWVHNPRDDNMIEGSFLIVAIVLALALAGIALARRAMTMGRRAARVSLPALLGAVAITIAGCGRESKPDEIWLETGAGEGQVVYPRGICYSKSDDTFFIVDRLARIQHLDHNGKFINGWRMAEWSQGKPVGLSVDPNGNLWVPDTHYSRIMVFTPEGKLIRQFGKAGRGKGEFIFPCDIAFDQAGRVFISEFGDHDRIQVFDQDLNYLFEFGRFGQGDGEFSRPQSMAIIGNTLYVTDACNHRISVWRTDGVFVRNFGTIGSDLGQFRYPYGLDVDSKGRLVVCEFGNNRLQLVDPASGKGLAAWGGPGREPGELAYPWAVAVDKKDRIIAVDSGNNRLQVFRF